MFDCIIIGKGPAGIACAVYLKRFNLNPLIIAKDNGALEDAHMIDNYYGLFHLSGHDLVEKGIDQAKSLDIEIVNKEVLSIEKESSFIVKTDSSSYEGKTIFLAMGKKKTELAIKNKNKFDGKGVSYCAICDGFFFRKKHIGIVGNGEYMFSELEVLQRFTKNITIFTNGEKLIHSAEGFEVKEDKIIDLVGEERLKSVALENEEVTVDGLFIALGSQSGLSLAKHLGLEVDQSNYLMVHDYQTNIEGIFAGGDIIGGLLQVSKAQCDGTLASFEIKKHLSKLGK